MSGYGSPAPQELSQNGDRRPQGWSRPSPCGSCSLADGGYLGQEAGVIALNSVVGVLEELQEADGLEMKGVTHGQWKKEFLLLSLVVQDFCLWVTKRKRSRGFGSF